MLPEKMVLRTSGASTSGSNNSGFATFLFPCRRRSSVRFNVEIDFYVISDHCSRGLGDSKILAIDRERGVRSHYFSALATDGPFQFKGKINVLGDAMDSQCAMSHVIIALFFYRFALEGNFRKFLHVKIVC